jgi:hypothetical protein
MTGSTSPAGVKLATLPDPLQPISAAGGPDNGVSPPPPPDRPITRQGARRLGDPPRQPVEEQPVARPSKTTLTTRVYYRGRWITITCEGMTLETFSDLLDARGIPREEEEPHG